MDVGTLGIFFHSCAQRAKYGLFFASTLLLVACGGSGSTSTPIVSATPTPTINPGTTIQSVTPTITTSGSIATLTPSLSATTLLGLGLTNNPTISGPSILASVVPSGAQVTYSNTAASSISTFSLNKHSRSTKSLTVPGSTALVYTTFTAPSTFTVPAGIRLAFSYALAMTPSSSLNYEIAYFNGTSWIVDSIDNSTLSGNIVSVSPTLTADVNFTAGTTYAVVLYSVPVSSSSPTPTPSSSPTIAPTPSSTTFPIGSAYLNYVQMNHHFVLKGDDSSGNKYVGTFNLQPQANSVYNGYNANTYLVSGDITQNGSTYINSSETFHYLQVGDSLKMLGINGSAFGDSPVSSSVPLPNNAPIGGNGTFYSIYNRVVTFGGEEWFLSSNGDTSSQTAVLCEELGLYGYPMVCFTINKMTASLSSPSVNMTGPFNTSFTLK